MGGGGSTCRRDLARHGLGKRVSPEQTEQGLKATVKNVGFIPDDGKPLDSSEKGSDVNRFMFLKNLTLLTDW